MPAEPQTITELSQALAAGDLTSEQITTSCLDVIADRDPSINAFITVLADEALAQARDADREIAAGRYRGPLHGVPLSIKDLFDIRGTSTTAASRVREGHIATADAPVITRLREAGAVFVGKTNLHEFALGATNEESAYGAVHHPLDPSRSPGGSSGGSAASVLAGMAYASIGSDTGGSIRIPASVCGLVGLKPAFGDIPTTGVVPLSWTLDHVGPICRSVADAALLYGVLSGSTATAPPPSPAERLKIGVLRGYFTELLDTQVAARFEQTVTHLEQAGVQIDEVSIPHAGDIAAIYMHIALSEAAAYHASTLETRPYAYTPNVRLRLEMGRYILAEDYIRALQGREVLLTEVDLALAGRDALLLPSMAVPATPLGAVTLKVGHREEPVRNVALRLTQAFNITAHPAITLPAGVTIEGLPIGIQLVGPARDTPALLQTAARVEALLS